VKGVAEIITVHGNVNIDYADVKTVMQKSNVFIMGTGYASGEGRAMEAVNLALESPLLDSNDIYGTKNILLNIISGKQEITIGEIGEIIETLQERAGQEAEIIWGNGYDESLDDRISVTILATGFITNPNQTLQPKVQPEMYGLDTQPNDEEQLIEKEEDIFQKTFNEDASNSESESESELELEMENDSSGSRDKVSNRNSSFIERITGSNSRKQKSPKPVPEASVDNWFFKNFGLGKLFEDDDDQPME
jgi:cell division protein FtsZ